MKFRKPRTTPAQRDATRARLEREAEEKQIAFYLNHPDAVAHTPASQKCKRIAHQRNLEAIQRARRAINLISRVTGEGDVYSADDFLAMA